jgi:hypothetical protein
MYAFQLNRQRDHQIQLRTAHFVIIPQTAMRPRHQLAAVAQVTGAKRVAGIQNPLIFSDDMSAAAPNQRIESVTVQRQIRFRNIAQRLNPWQKR